MAGTVQLCPAHFGDRRGRTDDVNKRMNTSIALRISLRYSAVGIMSSQSTHASFECWSKLAYKWRTNELSFRAYEMNRVDTSIRFGTILVPAGSPPSFRVTAPFCEPHGSRDDDHPSETGGPSTEGSQVASAGARSQSRQRRGNRLAHFEAALLLVWTATTWLELRSPISMVAAMRIGSRGSLDCRICCSQMRVGSCTSSQ